MNFQPRPYLPSAGRPLPFECVCLLLQGGGALGAYQGGVYEALAEADIHPDWMVGISIGAINAAIIAGNPPNARVDRLREFWTQVTSNGAWDWSRNPLLELARSGVTHPRPRRHGQPHAQQCTSPLAARSLAARRRECAHLSPPLQPGTHHRTLRHQG